uniref:ABC transporter permease n=1 Tax=candidate division WOR-3 bacterium TaxID=2052148 RepID=A0A7C3V022_UNCW3
MLELFLARRYIKAKRGISLIAILGIMVGVASITIVLSVINGFHQELRKRILGATPHIVITRYGYEPVENFLELEQKIRTIPEILHTAPFIYAKTLIKSEFASDGIVLRGILPEAEKQITEIDKSIIAGHFDFSENGIVLGIDLANNLRVRVGDKLTLISPTHRIKTPLGELPVSREYKVNGIFDCGLYDYNASFVYLSLKEAQEFLDIGEKVSGIEIKVRDIYRAKEIGKKIKEILGVGFQSLDWITLNKNLFTALRLEKIVTFIILTLIILVACFNIVAILTLMVIRKTKEIGILKAMGAKTSRITRTFILFGLLLGTIGSTLGIILGFVVSFLLSRYQFIKLPGDVYFIKRLPTLIQPSDFLLTFSSAILIALLATIYPARKAAKLIPTEALRYE